eukprot:5699273-Pyramimonas_sp.AAC.1
MHTEARREPWKDSTGAQPYYENLNDPKGGGPMYGCTVAAANVEQNETIQDKITRLQKTLGVTFNAIWHAWVKRAAL